MTTEPSPVTSPAAPAPTQRSETRTVSIAAPPDTVLDFLADPLTIPRWAPNFARAIRPDGEFWMVDTGGGELRIHVRVSREYGTVDLLRPGAPHGAQVGAFSRVISNGAGSEFMFTLFFDARASEDAIARQMTVVEEELRTVRTVCEAVVGEGR
jgi:hypothetical protein